MSRTRRVASTAASVSGISTPAMTSVIATPPLPPQGRPSVPSIALLRASHHWAA
jgi:hypothetical protein